jgi:hypothetical protein
MSRSILPFALTVVVCVVVASSGYAQKEGSSKPDVTGSVVAVAEDGKRVTLQMSKGSKERAAEEVTIKTDGADVAFSWIGPLEDRAAEGYQASVWLQPGTTDRAARVRYSGLQSFKAINRPPDIEGAVVTMTADGKRLVIEGRSNEKGGEPPQIEVNLTPVTDLRFNRVKAGQAKVEQGYYAEIWLDETRENAAIARLTAPDPTYKKIVLATPHDLAGEIVAVAGDQKSFTIEIPSREKGVAAERKEVRVEAETRVVYVGVPPDGAGLKEGQRAEVWFEARTICIDGNPKPKPADLVGRVVAVGEEGKTITVGLKAKAKGEEPARREIDISAARVMFRNVRPGEAKPAVGDEAQLWLDADRPTAAARVAFARKE